MRGWSDGCVDAVVTDPPYGIAKDRHRTLTDGRISATGAAHKGNWYNVVDEWDAQPPPRAAFDSMLRLSAVQVVFGGNYFAHMLPPSPGWIVWNKDNGNTKFADFEMAWTSRHAAARILHWRWNGMLQEPGHPKDKRVHPTQKPLGLMAWVVANYTNEGDVILDPYCGSGTTCVACIQLGRHFIGIEKEHKYVEIARRRVREAQNTLFAGATP